MHSLWKLKYSQKFEMEARRVPCTGRCWKVCTNSADVGNTASVPTDVITTKAILKEGMKKETHGSEPQGCAPELCQCSVSSRAALTPSQACHRVTGQCTNCELCTALIPCTSNPRLRQPCIMPTDSSFKISNFRDSTTCPGKVFQSFAILAVKANHLFGCLSSMSPAVI